MPQELTIQEVYTFQATSPNPPLLQAVEETIGILECPVCLTFTPEGMLAHINCDRIICATCCVALLNENNHCPICRLHFTEIDPYQTSGSSLRKLTPTELEYASKVLFECQICETKMNAPEAREHAECQQPLIRQPPASLQHQRVPATTRYEVISNPPATQTAWRYTRLIVARLNGRPIFSKMFPLRNTIRDVENRVAYHANFDDVVKTYKFSHRLLDPREKIGVVAPTDGATYLNFVTNSESLSTNTVDLLFEGVGAPVEPPRQPEVDPDLDWGF